MAKGFKLQAEISSLTEICKSLTVNEVSGAGAVVGRRCRLRPLCDESKTPVGLVNSGIKDRKPTPAAINAFMKFIYDEAPVVGFKVLRNDVVSVRMSRNPDELVSRLEGCKRGDIEYLSSASRRRLAIVAANCGVEFKSFITLTYPGKFPCDGKLVKRHFKEIMKSLRRFLGKFSYLWFLEFQQRGAPHFHIFCSVALPEPLQPLSRRSGRVRKVVQIHRPWQDWLSGRWFDIVGSGDMRHLRAGCSWEKVEKSDGCARYVAKECYKTFQKVVPENYQSVGRFWGTSRDISCDVDELPLVRCSADDMAKIFGRETIGGGEHPFPVLFGQADVYRKALDTPNSHAKRIAWKKERKGQKILRNCGLGAWNGVEHSSEQKRRVKLARANMEWHGSITNE